MNEKDDDIAHPGMLSRLRERAVLGQFSNSPRTGLRFHDNERAAPVKELPEGDHEEANRWSRSTRLGLTLQEEGRLFSKEQILGDERGTRTNADPEECEQLVILQRVAVRIYFLRSTAPCATAARSCVAEGQTNPNGRPESKSGTWP
jgi:hypothetical protein